MTELTLVSRSAILGSATNQGAEIMVDMSAIAGAFAALKGIKDLAESMIGLRDDVVFQEKRANLQALIIDAQDRVFAANQERSALIESVSELEAKIMKLETWETEKQRYKLDRLEPGVFVYTLKPEMAAGEPPHHICQTCYQRGKKSILHSDEPGNGVYNLRCSECGTHLLVGIFRAPPLEYED